MVTTTVRNTLYDRFRVKIEKKIRLFSPKIGSLQLDLTNLIEKDKERMTEPSFSINLFQRIMVLQLPKMLMTNAFDIFFLYHFCYLYAVDY